MASKRKTVEIDAAGRAPGRIATQIATILIGKHKASYSPHLDEGDRVVIQHAEQAVFTGKKLQQKIYRHHSNHPGGLKEIPAKKIMKEHPQEVIRLAVEKMLPKNRLRPARLQRLSFK